MKKRLEVWVVAILMFNACTVGSDETLEEDVVEKAQESRSNDIQNKRNRMLRFLRQSSGQRILSGQESMLWDSRWDNWFPSRRDDYVTRRTGKVPAVYSSDFGDFKNRDLGSEEDVSSARSMVVDAAKEYAREGSAIMLSYHMCPPDLPSGCSHEEMAGFSENNKYPEWKLEQILEPGTRLNRIHMERIDEIAGYLKELQDEGIVVLWRPFHELNQSWFWWGASSKSAELYRQMHHRMMQDHRLKNLIWVYSVNYWERGLAHPRRFYPGDYHVDMLGVDIYQEHGHEFSQRIYDELLQLADDDQPIGITENGVLPNDWQRFRNEQPNWVMWGTWFGFENRWSDRYYRNVYNHNDVTTCDEMPSF